MNRFVLLLILAALASCRPAGTPSSPTAPPEARVERQVFGGGTTSFEIINLEGTRCAIGYGVDRVAIDCDWRTAP